MAENKKEKKEKKEGEGMSDRKATEQIIALLVGLLFLAAIINGLFVYLNSLGQGSPTEIWAGIVDYFLRHIWPTWKLAAVIVSALAVVGIIYNMRKLSVIEREEWKIFNSSSEVLIPNEAEGNIKFGSGKWEKVMDLANSGNASDWRLAIIEADAMLEELLQSQGLHGDSVGEMLKSADENEFLTLDDAWEAHKARNAVAHPGANFQLNERETKRVMALFEKVFMEFGLI